MFYYEFPQIEKIDDVLNAIDGYEEFKVFEKGDYVVVNYIVSFVETFKWEENDALGSAIRRECRGIIFNKNGDIISRPYSKFFNVNEREETNINKINLYEPHVILEKLDGSMIRPIPSQLGFRLATKAGVTEIAMNAEKFIADKPFYAKFILSCIKKSVTPIFEWVSRKNRIVIDYPKDNLILTAIRNNKTGIYESYEIMKSIKEYYGIPVVKAITNLSSQNIHLLSNQIKDWDDGEGVVIRFDNGHMVKIKSDDYVLKHKTKEQISLEKNIIQVILDDTVDDICPLLPETDSKRLLNYQHLFWEMVNNNSQKMNELFYLGEKKYPDKKEFAVNYVQKEVPKQYASIMYGMKDGKNSKDIIVEMIKKSISSQPKIDQNRWLWGNLEWNSF